MSAPLRVGRPGASRRAATGGVQVVVPGSVGNVGAGFDAFGLALDLVLEVRARISDRLVVEHQGMGEGTLPSDERHLVAATYLDTCRRLGRKAPPLRFQVRNEIPIGFGLGSSGTAALAGVLIAAWATRIALTPEETVALAAHVEGHADNVAASLLGGLVGVARRDGVPVAPRRVEPIAGVAAWDLARYPIDRDLALALAIPDRPLETRLSRGVLPEAVPLEDAVHNLQSLALLPAALAGGDGRLVRALSDRLHQPARSQLVPGLAEALRLRMPGLLGVVLSGAGPTVLGLCTAKAAPRVARALSQTLGAAGTPARWLTRRPGRRGATVRSVSQGVKSPGHNRPRS